MHHFTRFSWLLGATLLGTASVAFAQAPPDAVAALRQALKAPAHEPETRVRALRHALDGLSGLGELRRALALQEWRDEDVDAQVSAIDRQYRGEMQQRFERAVRQVFEHGDVTSQVALLDLLGEVGVSVRGVGTQDGLGRVFSADIGRLATHGEPEVREAAARALGQVHADPEAATPALAGLLNAQDANLRHAAAASAAGMMHLAGQLAGKARSSAGVVGSRTDAATVARAVLPLAGRALHDPVPQVRRRGMEVVGWAASAACALTLDQREMDTLRPAGGGLPADDARAELLPLLVALHDQAPAIAAALGDSDGQVRALTRRSLELIADLRCRWLKGGSTDADPLQSVLKAAAPALAESVTDPDWRARRSAVNVLDSLGADAAPTAGALAQALQDPDRFVRWAAARALGKLAPGAATVAVPGLTRLLGDADVDLCLAAATALEQYGHAALPAAPALAEMVRGKSALEMRLAAVHALEQIGPAAASTAVPVLTDALTDTDPHVRHAAAVALGKYGPAAKDAIGALQRARGDSILEVEQAATEAVLNIAASGK